MVTISRDGVRNARATRRFSKQDWTYDSSKVEGADTQRSEGLTGLSALQTAEADAKAGAFATFTEATSASADDPDETLKRFVSFREHDTSPGGRFIRFGGLSAPSGV